MTDFTSGSPTKLPALLLVHGAWHGAWCWEDEFAPYMRELGFSVHSMNLPGHGQPGGARIPWLSIANYADAVEAELQGIGSATVVVGHSMGGYTVQKLMERRPENMAGAVMLAAATQRGVWGVAGHLLVSQPLEFLIANLTFNLYYLTRTPARTQALFHGPDMPAETVKKHWERIGNESYRAFLDMLLLAPIHTGKADPELPKLVLGGELDAIFPPNIVERTATSYGVTARIYPGMPHNLLQDSNWREVAGDIADFARSTRQ